MSSRRFISLYYASISPGRALQSILYWLRGPFASRRKRRAALERVVAAKTGARAVFATGSGRSALTLCLRAAGIGPGDDVMVSAYTCLAVASGVVAAGARPVYADIAPGRLNMDADTVSAALTPRVRAVIVQHTLGEVAPVDAIAEVLRGRHVLLIEDCALAIGSQAASGPVGSRGDAAVFSMELSKTLSSGWGGILTVNQPQLASAAARIYQELPEQGYLAASRDLWQTAISAWCHQPEFYDRVGKYVLYGAFTTGLFRRSTPPEEYAGGFRPDFSRKLSGAIADLARLQWRDLDRIAARCAANARALRAALHELEIEMPAAGSAGTVAVAPRVSFVCPERADIMAYFRSRGIELGEWFDGPMSPVPTAPQFNYHPGSYPNAEQLARHVVNLPSHSRLRPADLAKITNTLNEYYAARFAISN